METTLKDKDEVANAKPGVVRMTSVPFPAIMSAPLVVSKVVHAWKKRTAYLSKNTHTQVMRSWKKGHLCLCLPQELWEKLATEVLEHEQGKSKLGNEQPDSGRNPLPITSAKQVHGVE